MNQHPPVRRRRRVPHASSRHSGGLYAGDDLYTTCCSGHRFRVRTAAAAAFVATRDVALHTEASANSGISMMPSSGHERVPCPAERARRHRMRMLSNFRSISNDVSASSVNSPSPHSIWTSHRRGRCCRLLQHMPGQRVLTATLLSSDWLAGPLRATPTILPASRTFSQESIPSLASGLQPLGGKDISSDKPSLCDRVLLQISHRQDCVRMRPCVLRPGLSDSSSVRGHRSDKSSIYHYKTRLYHP